MKHLYFYSRLGVGGAERSTVRLLNALVARGHQVDLLLQVGGAGELERELDPAVTVISLKTCAALNALLSEPRPMKKLLMLPGAALQYAGQLVRSWGVCLMLTRHTYDAAFIGAFGLSPFVVCTFPRARAILQLIRNDVLATGGYGHTRTYYERYRDRIDHYLCVSEYTRRTLVAWAPEIEAKSVTQYNLLNAAEMRLRGEGRPFPYAGYRESLKVVTICRLEDRSKGLFRMLNVYLRLRAAGIQFLWFVVGDGPDREALVQSVQDAQAEDGFILMGAQENPFPYYKHADLVAVLSNYEGLCGVVNEAKVMERPLIATRFSGIDEQISEGVNGMIVDNDEDAIVAQMTELLTNDELRNQLAVNGLPEELQNDQLKIDRLLQLIETETEKEG